MILLQFIIRKNPTHFTGFIYRCLTPHSLHTGHLTEKFSQEIYYSLPANSQISLNGLNHGEVMSIW
jgi:hypothetical protein